MQISLSLSRRFSLSSERADESSCSLAPLLARSADLTPSVHSRRVSKGSSGERTAKKPEGSKISSETLFLIDFLSFFSVIGANLPIETLTNGGSICCSRWSKGATSTFPSLKDASFPTVSIYQQRGMTSRSRVRPKTPVPPADGSYGRDLGARRKSMLCHLRRRATTRSAVTPSPSGSKLPVGPYQPKGLWRHGHVFGVAAPRRWHGIDFVAAP